MAAVLDIAEQLNLGDEMTNTMMKDMKNYFNKLIY
jgi:hypothetical protein